MPELDRHLDKLTGSGALPEPQVQGAIERILESYGEVIPQYPTGDGPCDVFLPARRVVIEVKERAGKRKAASVGPDLPGSQSGETQFQQVERYVRALRRKEQLSLWGDLPDANTPWIGALTDGVRWWAWEWPAARSDEFVREHEPLHERSFYGGGATFSTFSKRLRSGAPAKNGCPPTRLTCSDRFESGWGRSGMRPRAAATRRRSIGSGMISCGAAASASPTTDGSICSSITVC